MFEATPGLHKLTITVHRLGMKLERKALGSLALRVARLTSSWLEDS